MDTFLAAQLLGVAAYTVQGVAYDHERGCWVASVRDMASHKVVERAIPGEHAAPERLLVVVDEHGPEPLPPADDSEKEHPGTGELGEGVEVPADGVMRDVDAAGETPAAAPKKRAARKPKEER